MHNKTLAELSKGLASGDFSSSELTKHYIGRIKQLDPTYNSFISVTEEQALAQATVADSRIASGNTTPLTGIPIAHKDIFCTAGVKTSCGSKMLDNFIPPYDATVVEKFNQSGVVSLGKTNMDELCSRRIFWWQCRSRGRPIGPGIYRHRYRRLNSSACGALRYNRPKTHIWTSFPLWDDCFCIQPRSGRAYDPHRRRCCDDVKYHGRCR